MHDYGACLEDLMKRHYYVHGKCRNCWHSNEAFLHLLRMASDEEGGGNPVQLPNNHDYRGSNSTSHS